MEFLTRMQPFSLLVMFLGALDWGIFGLFSENVLRNVLGTGDGLNVAYVVIGVAGLVWLPRIFEMMRHVDMHHPRAHRA